MKKLLLLTALSASMAFANTKLIYIPQTNSPACFHGVGCLPADMRLAGVMAFAHSEDEGVTAFLFTATATLADGSTVTRTALVVRERAIYWSPGLMWLAKDAGEFTNVVVTVTAQRASGDTVSGSQPSVEF